MLVNVERKCVVGLLAVITMDSWCDAVAFHMFSYAFQLMKSRIFKVEESAETNIVSLKSVNRKKSSVVCRSCRCHPKARNDAL